MLDTLSPDSGSATAHHDTAVFDQQRADLAADLGSELAWEIAGKPSTRTDYSGLSLAENHAQGVRLGRIANLLDEHALADPKAFLLAFRKAIDDAISDLDYDRKNEFTPREIRAFEENRK